MAETKRKPQPLDKRLVKLEAAIDSMATKIDLQRIETNCVVAIRPSIWVSGVALLVSFIAIVMVLTNG